jgi:ligand-binding sensor protein
MAKVTGDPVVEECDAGMLKIVVPLLVNGDLAGSVSGCGRLLEDSEIEQEYVAQATRSMLRDIRGRSATVKGITMQEGDAVAETMRARVAELVSAG